MQQEALVAALSKIAQDCILVYSSHSIEEVLQMHSDVAIMRNGRLLQELPAANVSAQSLREALTANMWG